MLGINDPSWGRQSEAYTDSAVTSEYISLYEGAKELGFNLQDKTTQEKLEDILANCHGFNETFVVSGALIKSSEREGIGRGIPYFVVDKNKKVLYFIGSISPVSTKGNIAKVFDAQGYERRRFPFEV